MSSSDEDSGKEENEFFVEKILDKRFVGKKVEYFIKWKGYDDPSDNTWEPVENCQCGELIEEFEKKWAEEHPPKQKEPKQPKKAPKPKEPKRKLAVVQDATPPKKPKDQKKPTRAVLSEDSDDEPTPPVQNEKELAKPASEKVAAKILETRKVIPVISACPNSANVPVLSYNVEKVIGLTIRDDQFMAVVEDNHGNRKFANPKSVARQNLDMMIDFFLNRIHVRYD
uniref:Chromo domain-containing protein n=1 Tax=Panagrolaimus sp. JU765 TaxID=591449 RepID=A0AC34RIF1_9BILA